MCMLENGIFNIMQNVVVMGGLYLHVCGRTIHEVCLLPKDCMYVAIFIFCNVVCLSFIY